MQYSTQPLRGAPMRSPCRPGQRDGSSVSAGQQCDLCRPCKRQCDGCHIAHHGGAQYGHGAVKLTISSSDTNLARVGNSVMWGFSAECTANDWPCFWQLPSPQKKNAMRLPKPCTSFCPIHICSTLTHVQLNSTRNSVSSLLNCGVVFMARFISSCQQVLWSGNR